MTSTRRALLGFFAGLPLAWKALSIEALKPEEELLTKWEEACDDELWSPAHLEDVKRRIIWVVPGLVTAVIADKPYR